MDKTVEIGGKPVKFTANAVSPFVFNDIFKLDYLGEMTKLYNEHEKDGTINSQVLYRIIYCHAKQADKSLPAMREWVAGFEAFPVAEIFSEIQDLVMINFNSKKNILTEQRKRRHRR